MTHTTPSTSGASAADDRPNRVEKTIDIDGRTIRYVDRGTGPAVLVIHGGPGWLGNLTSAINDLEQHHRILAPQLPGFGDSSGAGIETMRDIAAVLVAFMAALDVPSYSVLGSSVGAIPALWAAIDSPGTVEKIVLEAPAAFRAGVPRPDGPPPGAGDGPSREQIEYMLKVIGPDTDPDLVAAMPDCSVPALVLFGADDPLFPPRFGPEYKRLPAANLAIVYRAGHDIKGDRPEAFVATVLDYLERGPAFVINQASTLIHA